MWFRGQVVRLHMLHMCSLQMTSLNVLPVNLARSPLHCSSCWEACTLTVSMGPERCRVSHTRTVPSHPADANTHASAGAHCMSSTEPSCPCSRTLCSMDSMSMSGWCDKDAAAADTALALFHGHVAGLAHRAQPGRLTASALLCRCCLVCLSVSLLHLPSLPLLQTCPNVERASSLLTQVTAGQRDLFGQ